VPAGAGIKEAVMKLDLTEEERALLADILDEDFRNLKEEINKTEGYDFKNALKARERLLQAILAKLEQPVTA
jgi:hypothetical protein